MISFNKKVAIGSDDLYPIADFVVEYLRSKGFEITPIGSIKTRKPEPWPLVGYEVGKLVASGEVSWGIVICYTGTGVSIAANKVKGVRAALCGDPETARGARLWNDANVLALSGRLTTSYLAKEILDAWLSVEKPDESELKNIEMLMKMDIERM
ncbi:MAG: RpiB/LacA/LacB family sugar-phosphate isomerase [Ignisphaera sp.]|uniref:RpiB/LacA/LacB family sugar-phosphate isomerase n=1 Tax=Ignisphaera aggregans TaxID=334771 RepID=A0A7J3MZU0_9CREN